MSEQSETGSVVAVLGTGIMGSALARRLRAAGFDVTAWNRTAEHAAPLAEDGIRVVAEPAAAVAEADVVITTLLDADAVVKVAQRFLPALPTGAVWVQAATIGMAGIRRAAELAEGAGVALVDAPVLGTSTAAESGELVVLAAGPPERVAALAEVFGAYATRVVDAGAEVGHGSALKLACNTWIASLTAGTAQALAVAGALGADPRLFLEAIEGTATDSRYAHLKGGAMLEQSYPRQFAAAGLLKDLRLAQDAAGSSVAPDLLDALAGLFAKTEQRGHGNEDIAAVAEAFEPAPTPLTRGPAHIGLTVPDLEEATAFLRAALGAKVSYTTLTTHDAPREGAETEHQLDIAPGAKLVAQRFLQIGTGPGIELFQASGTTPQPAASLTDLGWEHLAFYVDDIEAVAARAAEAGGRVVSKIHGNSTFEDTPGNASVYVRAPWGFLIELQTYPEGLYYPDDSESPRWTPPRTA